MGFVKVIKDKTYFKRFQTQFRRRRGINEFASQHQSYIHIYRMASITHTQYHRGQN